MWSHNRQWENFDSNILTKPFGIFMLSSDTGTGKSTFLRHLQLALIKKSNLIPVFIYAADIEKSEIHNVCHLAEHIAKEFSLDADQSQVQLFFEQLFENNKIVLLIDGLDQIGGVGTEYKAVVKKITDVIKSNLLIASRPTAVTSYEDNPEITFLRMKPLNMELQRRYFGEHFKRACELTAKAPDLAAVPILAYMVRTLIEVKQDRNIKNRKDLYEQFVNYILTEYKHDKAKLSRHKAVATRYVLERISYDALNEKKPTYTQVIPEDFSWERVKDTGVELDDLPKYGLVNLIVEKHKGIGGALYFSHLSF